MTAFSEEDINRALIQVYDKNKQNQQKKEDFSQKKESDEERRKRVFREAEARFLSSKVIEPCGIKEIHPFPLTRQQEDFLIPEFIHSTYAYLPSDHTMAMEGNPYTVLVQMENGLVYMVAISQVMHIYWPGGIQGEIYRQMEKESKGLIRFKNNEKDGRPIILADTRDYHAQIYPMHLNKNIQQYDCLGVFWRPSEDIINISKPGLSYMLGNESSFQGLKDQFDGVFIDFMPVHIRKMLKTVQTFYDQARAEKKIGKPIYARFDPDKPMAGRGWTITIFPWEKRQYFDIPSVKYVNPNRPKNPLQIISTKPIPKRIAIDRASLGLKRNIHE